MAMIEKRTLLFITLLTFMTGCGQSISSGQTEEVPKEVEETKKVKTANDLLKNMGFDLSEEKMVIDMNKTTHFFEKIEIEMHGKADEIERKIEHADINFTKGIGIEISDDRIALDLNKTRDMLQQLNILVKDIVLDINSSLH
jgi:hypothetical protein